MKTVSGASRKRLSFLVREEDYKNKRRRTLDEIWRQPPAQKPKTIENLLKKGIK
jgi:hypothetical protein